mmetsp:Transcript_77759/g.155743  ORF Transcript_77759/g.155743 Transcript_77759/m.155743 type:complete len:274 (-) Transcript_77759:1223-2044(-)
MDELDSFFDDIASVEAAAPVTEEEVVPPPTKRPKPAEAAPIPQPPAKVIAAAAKPSSFSFSSSATVTSTSVSRKPAAEAAPVAVAEPSPWAVPPPLPPPREQFKQAHMGLTHAEAVQLESQQGTYDYDKQQKLAAMGIKPGVKHDKHVRSDAYGGTWEDASLSEWPENDYRLFVGDLGNEVSEDMLARAFSKYPSFARNKVIRCKFTGKSKGFGFASFTDPFDCAKCLREMQGKYIGNRPIRLTRSTWEDREVGEVKKKRKQEKKRKKALGLV